MDERLGDARQSETETVGREIETAVLESIVRYGKEDRRSLCGAFITLDDTGVDIDYHPT